MYNLLNKTLKFVQSLELFEPISIYEKFKKWNSDAATLLSKILIWDPNERPSAAQALLFPFYEEYREITEEEEDVKPFDWSFTEADISIEDWKKRTKAAISSIEITKEVSEFKK